MATNIFKLIYSSLVYALATFIADVLNHPVMTDALVTLISKAVAGLLREPDIDDHLLFANEKLDRTRDKAASKAGHDVPKTTKSFLKGLFHIDRNRNRSESDDRSEIEPSREGEGTPKSNAHLSERPKHTDEVEPEEDIPLVSNSDERGVVPDENEGNRPNF